MGTMFLVCAVIGGTIFIVQFVLAIIGFGADDLDFVDDIDLNVAEDAGSVIDHGSTWLFGVISFRTVVAAVTFFGLTGMASMQAGQHPMISLLIATVCGLAAMYGVHFLMRAMFGLKHDGTVRIERSVGRRATVYVPIPADKSGTGKVQLRLTDRVLEELNKGLAATSKKKK